MRKLFPISLSLTITLSACGDGGSEQPGSAVDSAPGPDSHRETAMEMDSRLEPHVEQASSDLADRLEIDNKKIKIAEAQFVTWPNGALGCPEPGMMYTQALVPGYQIRLIANGTSYHYHGARDRPPFYCPTERVTPPAADSEARSDVR